MQLEDKLQEPACWRTELYFFFATSATDHKQARSYRANRNAELFFAAPAGEWPVRLIGNDLVRTIDSAHDFAPLH